MTPVSIPNDLIDWLLAGDVAIQYQVHRDLLDEERPDLRARIAVEGWGKQFLAARRPDGHWGKGFYQPKWISTHYTLLDLKHLGIAPDHAQIRESIGQVLAQHKSADGGVNPAKTVENSDVCVNGMVLNYAAYFGTPTAPLQSVVDFLIGVPLPDGGFNCESNQHGAVHSSLHSTISVLEGIGEYLANGYTYRAAELEAIAQPGAGVRAAASPVPLRPHRRDHQPQFPDAVLSLALVLRHPAGAGLLRERRRGLRSPHAGRAGCPAAKTPQGRRLAVAGQTCRPGALRHGDPRPAQPLEHAAGAAGVEALWATQQDLTDVGAYLDGFRLYG